MATSTAFGLDGSFADLRDNTLAVRLFGVGLGFVVWTLVASIFPARLMPFPTEALALTWMLVQEGVVWANLQVTLWRLLWGFAGAVTVGGFVGIAMGSTGYGKQFFTPYIVVGLSIPAVGWAAISSVIFGFSLLAPASAVVLTTFPYIAINIWKGVENIDAELVEMSSAFDISNRRLVRRMLVPDVAPALFASARFGLATGWKIVTIAEVFSASNGVGYKIVQSYNYYKFEQAWAWAIVFLLVVLIIEYVILKPLEHRMFSYRPDADVDVVG